MITVIQRVAKANVSVGGEMIGAIERGIMALVAVEPGDTEQSADRLLERILNYRVFPDAEGRMNLALNDIDGGLLLVPQFTLAADTRKGNRPSFSAAAAPEYGRRMFEYLVKRAQASYACVACGRFGADMQVLLINDGPVTFTLTTARSNAPLCQPTDAPGKPVC
ncbi:MAG: D-aminoacyl-tRNA deacylase [Gammaproteobacteria bacterium]